MTKCVRTFEYIDSITSGWRPAKTPSFDPMSIAYGVVHDALEHFEEGEEGIENEMMAFGSIYHIRVQGGWWNQFGANVNADKMMAWDVARFLAERNLAIEHCPVEMTKAFHKIADKMWPDFVEEMKKYERECDTELVLAYGKAMAWMNKGYTRSLKRWKGHEPVTLTQFFNDLTAKVEDYMVGKFKEQMKISFNTRTLDYSVELM